MTSRITGYGSGSAKISLAPVPTDHNGIPTSNTAYDFGQLVQDYTTGDWYIYSGASSFSAIAVSSGAVVTVDGDTGSATASSGVITLAGTSNEITTAASSHTVTFSIPSTFIAPGSIASTTSITAGNALTVTAGGAAITGNSTINSSGAGTTIIGTGGTGYVHIGNATGNTAVTGSLTASTGLVATTGGVTATAGNITATNGNVILSHAATYIGMKAAAVTDFAGTANLTSGTVTILNTNIASGDLIFLSRISATGSGSSTTLGILSYTISASTNFVVTSLIIGTPGSTQTGDNSSFAYFIVRPQ